METERICPSCYKPLAPDMPLGLCPECLLKAGLNTGPEPATGSSASSGFVPPSVADIAKLFPQLEILEFIGKGGMGAVYKARQPGLDRLVALKILPPAAASGPGFAERFNREARALARLSHPNIVTVHDFGQVAAGAEPNAPAGTLHYLIMEFVDGGNLRQIERAGQFTPEQALAIVPQICEALQFAHNEGIVHRDIKPENILMDKRGRVKITDFGIAKILGLTGDKAPLTGAQDVVGTPHYMAPEQIEKPRTVDHRADIYSLGVVFYEMLTGELPIGRFAPPSRKVQVDVRLDDVVLHALEKEPELRYQQASQVKTAVENIANTSARASNAPGAEARPDPEALERQILARDYYLDIGRCLRRGGALVRRDFWSTLGVTWLILILLGAAAAFGHTTHHHGGLTFDTSVLSTLLSGPLMGGLYYFLLLKIRGQHVSVETAFAGFKASLVNLFLAGFVAEVLTLLGFACLILPGIYLLVAWTFALPLVIDKGLEFWPAMRISRRTITRHWWKVAALLLVMLVVNICGVLACGIGVAVTVPITFAALMYAYEDIINGPGLPPAEAHQPARAAPAAAVPSF
jgi:predicted Ser/Thr protein kinase